LKRGPKRSLEELQAMYVGKVLTKRAELDIEDNGFGFTVYLGGPIARIYEPAKAPRRERSETLEK